MAREKTCGADVAPLLVRLGVEVVFGIPGNHTLELYRGLSRTLIRHITTRHEQGAAFMADGYARASGRVGVCLLISGPGLLNAATAIAQARADSVPMLVITAVGNERADVSGGLHALPDQTATAQSICLASHTVKKPDDLHVALLEAWRCATAARPGPVHLQIPVGVQTQPATGVPVDWPAALSPAPYTASEEQLMRAAQMLSAASRPVVVLGGGAVGIAGDRSSPSQCVMVAETIDAPIVTTVNAKGLVPAGHPLAVGSSPSLECVAQLIDAADVVLALGTEWGETDFQLLPGTLSTPRGEVIRVDIDPAQLQCNVHADVAVVADAATFADALVPLLRAGGGSKDPGEPDGAARAATVRAEIQRDAHYHLDFAAMFDAIDAAAQDLLLVGDSTRPTYYAAWMFERPAPRRYFHSVSGFGTLGYAIPAAFGARLAVETSVAALIGDGGAQYSLTEIATALDAGIGVPIIVWCNRGFEEIENSMQGEGIDTSSTVISSPDFERIAQAYAIPYYEPDDFAEFATALTSALKLKKPSLIVLQQDRLTSTSGRWYG